MKRILTILLILFVSLIFLCGCTGTPENETTKIVETTPNPVLTQEAIPEITQITPQPTITVMVEETNISEIKSEVKVNGIDIGNAGKMGPMVIASIKEITPIYSAIRDDFAVKDYDKMAIDALKLRRYSEDKFEEIAHDNGLPNIELLGELSSKDMQVFTKYKVYIAGLIDLAISIQTPLSWIKDDPSKVSLLDKMDSFTGAIAQSKNSYDQLEKLMDTCDEFGADCGQNLSEIKVLEKPIEFF